MAHPEPDHDIDNEFVVLPGYWSLVGQDFVDNKSFAGWLHFGRDYMRSVKPP